MSSVEQKITDYLSGYTRNNPIGRALVESYPDWARLAQVELDNRAAKLMEVFGVEELQAIATGAVSLPALVLGVRK